IAHSKALENVVTKVYGDYKYVTTTDKNDPNIYKDYFGSIIWDGKGNYYLANADGSYKLDKSDLTDALAKDQDWIDHGTSVSKVIAANAVNTVKAGIANDVLNIYAAQLYKKSGEAQANRQDIAYDLLYNHGVKLFNFSNGSSFIYLDEIKTTQKLVDKGALLIYSAGNKAFSQPNADALMPANNPNLEKGILAVVGLDEKHEKLKRYTLPEEGYVGSNACGSAARWCIASDFVHNVYDESTGDVKPFWGTSGAAPDITATAALVWYNFDWMTNDQVRQTILTTATYIDDKSKNNGLYNETTGWGYYNYEKAKKGMGKFSTVFGDFNANLPLGTVSTFSNDISGDAGLVKTGDGRLILSGKNTYTGLTTVKQGELKITGSTAASALIINLGGTLLGTGNVGTVTNLGNISTEDGSFTINGDYQQGSSGTLTYRVGKTLTSTGNASLDGKLVVTNKNISNASLITKGYYEVLKANTIKGKFSDVSTASTFLTVDQVNYDAQNNVIANISYNDAAKVGVVQGASTVSSAGGKVVNKILNQANNDAQTNSNNIALTNYAVSIQATESAQMAQAILNSNSGSIFAESPSVLQRNQSIVNGSVNRRTNWITEQGVGVWTSANILKNKSSAQGWDNVTSNINAQTVGLDTAIQNGVIGGYLTNYSEDSTYSLNNDRSKVNQVFSGIYGKYSFANQYILAHAHYGTGKNKITRNSITATTNQSIQTKANVDSYGIYTEFGANFTFKQWLTFTPFLGLSYDAVKLDSVRENHATGLNVSAVSNNQTELHMGLRMNAQVANQISVGTYAEYTNAIHRRLDQVTVANNISSESTTSYNAPQFKRDYATFGLNTQYTSKNRRWNTFADIAVVTDDKTNLQGQVGIKYNF
ncbi:autotransporter domain-containing protein, partial [Acinetobacter nectaris]|uniref:autotransporter domain-containing protein n=1 Tax=Acinetobacter nectaris TaxID=1219382 RepID=UPI001F0113AC